MLRMLRNFSAPQVGNVGMSPKGPKGTKRARKQYRPQHGAAIRGIPQVQPKKSDRQRADRQRLFGLFGTQLSWAKLGGSFTLFGIGSFCFSNHSLRHQSKIVLLEAARKPA